MKDNKILYQQKKELLPLYDSAKSFYKKAYYKEIEIEPNFYKVILLYSYDTLVASITENKGILDFYLNSKIDKKLLFSQTTLRHIKEFYNQFYCEEKLTKKDLIFESIKKDFDYLLIKEKDNNIDSIEWADNNNYFLCTNNQTKKQFKNMFEGYRQKLVYESIGTKLYTSCKYGKSNYYFYKSYCL